MQRLRHLKPDLLQEHNVNTKVINSTHCGVLKNPLILIVIW